MVRGNWQQRVEKADARKRESKEKKRKSEEKRLYKGYYQDLIQFLDQQQQQENDDNDAPVLHVWSEQIPNYKNEGDTAPEENTTELLFSSSPLESPASFPKKGKRKNANNGRPRSISIESNEEPGGSRRGTPGKSNNKKKIHPRSKESTSNSSGNTSGTTAHIRATTTPTTSTTANTVGMSSSEANYHEALTTTPYLCYAHFFQNKCGPEKGLSYCPYIHYYDEKNPVAATSENQDGTSSFSTSTLAQVVSAQDATDSGQAIQNKKNQHDDDNGDAIPMLYHSRIVRKTTTNTTTTANTTTVGDSTPPQHTNNDTPTSISMGTYLHNQLAQTCVHGSSVIYVSVNDVLVYDRYRQGLLLTELEYMQRVYGESSIPRRHRFSIGSEHDQQDNTLALLLNATILEHILTFLPDPALSVLSLVCRNWNSEIRHSLHLWKHLLQRNNWPFSLANQQDFKQAYQNQFISHYSIRRDIRALKTAIQVLHHRKRNVPEVEFTYQDFASRKNRPSPPNDCVGVTVWSSGQVLAGYSRECSLRLFESTTTAQHSAGSFEKRCKELVCLRIDPYQTTKKRQCELIAFEIDEQNIGCLCRVNAEGINSDAYILITISRDEFLLGVSSDSADYAHKVETDSVIIDIGESVLNYLICLESADHVVLDLMTYLEDGGEIGMVEVSTAHSLVPCGDGRFIVEVIISIPIDEIGVDVMPERFFRSIGRKFVMISTTAGAIVWIGDSHGGPRLVHPMKPLAFDFARDSVEGRSRKECYFAAVARDTQLFAGKIEASGELGPLKCVRQNLNPPSTEADWLLSADQHRKLAVCSDWIIVGDVFVRREDEEIMEGGEEILPIRHGGVKSHLSLYPGIDSNEEQQWEESLGIGFELLTMTVLRKDYLLVLGRRHRRVDDGPLYVENIETGAPDTGNELDEVLEFVAFHVGSRQKIHREAFVLKASAYGDSVVPRLSRSSGGTVGVGYGCYGIALTGLEVQSQRSEGGFFTYHDTNKNTSSNANNNNRKKKKGRHGKGKKDGFARGMSLRG